MNMYRLIDLDTEMCGMVFSTLSFNSHIERQLNNRGDEDIVFDSEIECNAFRKEYNDLFYKGYQKSSN